MPRIYSRIIEVPDAAIDRNGHVNNLEYLRWMQEIATEHSAARGWSIERYLETGCSWVVRSHFVEYVRPAYAGDRIAAHTWVHDMGSSSSRRRYLFRREGDGTVVARAETLWVFVDIHSGRARRIPQELRASFHLVTAEDEALKELEPH